jgi:hypothetical protein
VIRPVAQYRPHDRWLLHGREATPTLEESLGFEVANIGFLKKASPLGSVSPRAFVTQRRKKFRCSLLALRGILSPWIEDLRARFEELAGIARHNCKPMVQPGCSNDEIGL